MLYRFASFEISLCMSAWSVGLYVFQAQTSTTNPSLSLKLKQAHSMLIVSARGHLMSVHLLSHPVFVVKLIFGNMVSTECNR